MLKKMLRFINIKIMSEDKYIAYLRHKGVKIGQECEIHKEAIFGSEPYLITIGNHVRITRGVKFVTHDGGLWVLRKLGKCPNADHFGSIVIGDNTHIGWDSTIMPGVHIGNNCVIGCSSVVTKDIPDNSVAVGVPARVIETIDQYYEKNAKNLVPTYGMSASEKELYLKENYESLFG